MCGKRLKLSLLLLVLLFSQSLHLFSEVVLTDQEFQELTNLIETSLMDLEEYRIQLMEVQAILDREVRRLKMSSKELSIQRINYSLLWKSYELQRKRIDLLWLDRIGGFIVGFGAGYGVDEIKHQFK